MVVLTTDRTRVACLKRWPFVLLLGITWLLVLISVGVASSLKSLRALLVVAPLSRVSFRLVFSSFLNHVRRIALLVIWLARLVLGRLHKVHLCIILHRQVLCWGMSIMRSVVCEWLLGASSSVNMSIFILVPLSWRIGSSMLIRWCPTGQILWTHVMNLVSVLWYALGRIIHVTRVLNVVSTVTLGQRPN